MYAGTVAERRAQFRIDQIAGAAHVAVRERAIPLDREIRCAGSSSSPSAAAERTRSPKSQLSAPHITVSKSSTAHDAVVGVEQQIGHFAVAVDHAARAERLRGDARSVALRLVDVVGGRAVRSATGFCNTRVEPFQLQLEFVKTRNRHHVLARVVVRERVLKTAERNARRGCLRHRFEPAEAAPLDEAEHPIRARRRR